MVRHSGVLKKKTKTGYVKGKDGMGIREGLGMIILWDLHIGIGYDEDQEHHRQLELRLLMCTLKIDFRSYPNLSETHIYRQVKHTHTLNLQSCGSIDTFNLTQSLSSLRSHLRGI